MLVQIDDLNGVRTLTLNRPEALNAFNEALYDATTIALRDADADADVAVVLITGAGRAFSAGNDLVEMQARITDPDFQSGQYGFAGMIETLTALRKPLILAVNGLGVGIGATILGYADLVFMSSTARLKCPFTSLEWPPRRRPRICCRSWSAGRMRHGCCCPRSGSMPRRRSGWVSRGRYAHRTRS